MPNETDAPFESLPPTEAVSVLADEVSALVTSGKLTVSHIEGDTTPVTGKEITPEGVAHLCEQMRSIKYEEGPEGAVSGTDKDGNVWVIDVRVQTEANAIIDAYRWKDKEQTSADAAIFIERTRDSGETEFEVVASDMAVGLDQERFYVASA